jgi:hypothetical protein
VELLLVFQGVHDLNQLSRGQAEDASIPSGLTPVSTDFGGELEPYSDLRFDIELSGSLEYEIEFTRAFDDKKTVVTGFEGVEGKIDELLILVPVADQTGLRIIEDRKCCNEFSLTARLESMVIAPAEIGDLIDDLLLLIYLLKLSLSAVSWLSSRFSIRSSTGRSSPRSFIPLTTSMMGIDSFFCVSD